MSLARRNHRAGWAITIIAGASVATACRIEAGARGAKRDGGATDGARAVDTGAGGGAGDGAGGGSGGAGSPISGTGGDGTGGMTPRPTLDWRDLSPCKYPKPTPVYDLAPRLAFDRDRRKLILYGGHSRDDAFQSPFILPSPASGNLWEMDAVTGAWTDLTSCSPVGFYTTNGTMIYDPRRRRAVVFAGPNGDVGEWDPATNQWTDRPPAGGTVAAAIGFPRIAVYDEARARAVVFVKDDEAQISAWEWEPDAARWTARQADLPLFRDPDEMPAIAYDGDRAVMWLFGGGGGELLDHLWRWDLGDPSAGLVDVTPAVRPAAWPSARFASGLAYDAGRGRLILYGGVFDDYLRDLWEWDPATSTWQSRTPAGVTATGTDHPDGVVWPPAGLDASRIFADPAGNQILLYAWGDGEPRWAWRGDTGTWSVVAPAAAPLWPESSPPLPAWNGDDSSLLAWIDADLWRWTPQAEAWELLTPPALASTPPPERDATVWPQPRINAAAAYDPAARKLVFFAGRLSFDWLNDLWIWDPVTREITRPLPASGAAWPAPRSGHAMAYDPVRQRVLVFGGWAPDAAGELHTFDDLWALDTASARWEDLTPPASSRSAAGIAWPAARTGHALWLDADRGVLMLLGGSSNGAFDGALVDVWELGAGSTTWTFLSDAGTGWSGPGPVLYGSVAFAPGRGLYAVTQPSAEMALWRWDPALRAWTDGGPLPRSRSLDYGFSLIGIDGGLLFLMSGSSAGLPEDALFWQTWRATLTR